MAEFLDVARDIFRVRGKTKPHFKEVLDAIGELQLVHSKSQLDLVNVESIFATFEMAKIVQRFGNYKSDRIPMLAESMKVVIAETIEETLKFPRKSDDTILPPRPYRPFLELAKNIAREARRSVSIITFNYDIGLDYAFLRQDITPDYALSPEDRADDLPLLKLHGSLNWATCPTCRRIVAMPVSEILQKYRFPSGTDVRLRASGLVRTYVHCAGGEPLGPALAIVPPSWNKSDYHMAITSVWARAAQELSTAENIFVIGYSMPETDGFFRSLYALGSIGPAPLERFWVFNPDRSGQVEGRFRALLGPGAAQRFAYHPMTFTQALEPLKKVFSISLDHLID